MKSFYCLRIAFILTVSPLEIPGASIQSQGRLGLTSNSCHTLGEECSRNLDTVEYILLVQAGPLSDRSSMLHYLSTISASYANSTSLTRKREARKGYSLKLGHQ